MGASWLILTMTARFRPLGLSQRPDRAAPSAQRAHSRAARPAYRRAAVAALVHDLTVVTRNRIDFEKAEVRIIDPFGDPKP